MPVLLSFQGPNDIRVKCLNGSGMWMRNLVANPGTRIVFAYHRYITSLIYPAHSRILGVNPFTGNSDIYSYVRPGRR